MLKILHILNELRFSGAEMLLSSAAEIFRDGGEHTILSTGDAAGEYASTLASSGFTVVHKPFRKRAAFFVDLYRHIRAGRFDVVHIHTERASFWYGLLARAAGASCVRTIHSEFLFEGDLRRRRSLQRKLLIALGVRHVACSPRVARNERSRFGINATVIDNWIDPTRIRLADPEARADARRRLGIATDAFVIVSVGNYGPAKNHEAIIEGVRLCAPELRVEYYHCGASDETLWRIVDPTVADQIRFVGPTTAIGDWLAASDAFVCSSLYEGGPIALLEAAAAGIPCITTRVGLAEAFEGLSGVTFVASTAEDLKVALTRLAGQDRTRRAQWGQELSRMVLSRFTPAVGGSAYVRLYTSLAPPAHAKRNRGTP